MECLLTRTVIKAKLIFFKKPETTQPYLYNTWILDHTEVIMNFKCRYNIQSYTVRSEVREPKLQLQLDEMIDTGHLKFEAIYIPGHTQN